MQFNGQRSAAADVVDIGFSNTVVASRVSSLHDAAIIVTFSSALLVRYISANFLLQGSSPLPSLASGMAGPLRNNHLCTNSICALQFRET